MFIRRIQKSTILVFATFALSSCVSLQTETTHQPGFDFTKWKSYTWAKNNPRPAVAAGAPGTQSVLKFVKRNLERALNERGYRKAAFASANFKILIRVGTWAKPRFGPGQKGIEGMLTLRFIDHVSGEVAWEGHAHETWLSSMDTEEEIRKAIDLLLEDYPPS